MMVSNRNLLFQGSIFRFHVCFGGCTFDFTLAEGFQPSKVPNIFCLSEFEALLGGKRHMARIEVHRKKLGKCMEIAKTSGNAFGWRNTTNASVSL